MLPGFEGHWIGPYGDGFDFTKSEYDGYLRGVAENKIHSPTAGVRLYFEDCNDGFTCIKTRWREDDLGRWNNPENRYLQVLRQN